MKHTIILVLCALFSFQGIQAQDAILEAIKSNNVERLGNVLMVESIDNCIDIKGNSYNYLSAAIKLGSTEAVEYLILAGANVDAVCTDKTPLMYAAKYGQIESLKRLLKAGANPDIKNGDRSVADYAKQYKQKKITKYLKSTEAKN